MTTGQNTETEHVPKETSSGNFIFGSWAGDVKYRYGHEVRLFNIGRGHWVACDQCRTYT